MRLYNTLTRQKEPFAPAADNLVRLYACGLTVYARGHIGNFRTFVSLDVLRRALKYQDGYLVRPLLVIVDLQESGPDGDVLDDPAGVNSGGPAMAIVHLNVVLFDYPLAHDPVPFRSLIRLAYCRLPSPFPYWGMDTSAPSTTNPFPASQAALITPLMAFLVLVSRLLSLFNSRNEKTFN